jgi:hypothetical protein
LGISGRGPSVCQRATFSESTDNQRIMSLTPGVSKTVMLNGSPQPEVSVPISGIKPRRQIPCIQQPAQKGHVVDGISWFGKSVWRLGLKCQGCDLWLTCSYPLSYYDQKVIKIIIYVYYTRFIICNY